MSEGESMRVAWQRRVGVIGAIAAAQFAATWGLSGVVQAIDPSSGLAEVAYPVAGIILSLLIFPLGYVIPSLVAWPAAVAVVLNSALWAAAIAALIGLPSGKGGRLMGGAGWPRRLVVGSALLLGSAVMCLVVDRSYFALVSRSASFQFATALCYRPLPEFCGGECPAYIDVDPDCDGRTPAIPAHPNSQYPGRTTACGANYVTRHGWEFEGQSVTDTWVYFSRDGEMVAALIASDTDEFCNHKSAVVWYGQPVLCTLAESPVDVDCSRWQPRRVNEVR